MRNVFILASLLLCIDQVSLSQMNTDSLRRQVSLQESSSAKASMLITLCEQFRFVSRDSLFSVAQELYELGKKEKNETWKSHGDFFKATYYNLSGRPDTALVIAEKNISTDAISKDNALLIKYYSLAGNSLMRLNRQRDALQMFYSCLTYADRSADHDAQFKAQNNIGWAHMELEQHDKAIQFFRASLATIHRYNLQDRYGTIYNNIASCYGSLGHYDSVYKYASSGINIAGRFNDYATLANGYSIMGTFQARQEKYNEALASFKKAVVEREKIGDPFFIVSDLAEIADLQSRTGQAQEGIKTGLQALAIAKENKIEAKLPMIYTALAHNYEKMGSYREAAGTYKLLNELKDSLYQAANPKALAEIQTKYETEKKERQIEQQQSRIRFQNLIFVGIGLLVFLGAWLAYSLYKRYKLRQETKLQTELMQQQALSVKAVMEAEENERQRIAKDLHDGVGQMMSAAKMNLSAFESEIAFANLNQQKSFTKVISLVDESCREVRNVSHTMMPIALTRNDLATAVHEFVDKLDQESLRVQVYTEGLEQRLDSNTEMVLYRVIQECVNNVIKHANATTLDISVIRNEDGIDATIEDNGKGFDPQVKSQQGGIGLRNIITRIEFLKGTVDFDSSPGRGTVVALHVPLT
jgi:two-component system NarL family sensor kinase